MSDLWNKSGIKTLAALIIIGGGAYSWREHANAVERRERAQEAKERAEHSRERELARARAALDAGAEGGAKGATAP